MVMEELTRLLDEVLRDRYLGTREGFLERVGAKGERKSWEERGWEGDAKEFEEMMEMVLGIMARGWPGLEGR
jgi:hypothetical protein